MHRRILLASAIALATGCGLESYGLPGGDASFVDQLASDSPDSDASATPDDATIGEGGSGSTDGGAGDSSTAGDSASGGCAPGLFSCGALGCMPTCQGCIGSPLACASKGTCESSCSACPSRDIECYLCDSGLPIGRCDTHSASECLGANYQHCSCAILPCLSLNQVCANVPGLGIHSECRTCGEDKTNSGSCGIFQHCDQSATICN